MQIKDEGSRLGSRIPFIPEGDSPPNTLRHFSKVGNRKLQSIIWRDLNFVLAFGRHEVAAREVNIVVDGAVGGVRQFDIDGASFPQHDGEVDLLPRPVVRQNLVEVGHKK